jgi:hypothetical protein
LLALAALFLRSGLECGGASPPLLFFGLDLCAPVLLGRFFRKEIPEQKHEKQKGPETRAAEKHRRTPNQNGLRM